MSDFQHEVRDDSNDSPALRRFHKYCLKDGAFPHPTVVLEKISPHVWKAYLKAQEALANGFDTYDTHRQNYVALLANECLGFERPKKSGPKVSIQGER